LTPIDHEKSERFQSAFPARTPEMVAKHRARAVEQLASHRCSTDLTDGFCGPQDGKCHRGLGTYRNCVVQAESLLQAIENRGCTVVWAYDREMLGTK
jgi:hypothetical protein